MDLPFLIVGGHIFWDSELAATEIERWVAYITFISEIILTISKIWIISINHNLGDIWFSFKISAKSIQSRTGEIEPNIVRIS